MELMQLQLESNNKLVNEYIHSHNERFFHYSYWKNRDLMNRYDELMNRQFPRKQLSMHIRKYMEKFSLSKEVENSLHKLEDEKTVVIIGGQQAGLLLGPMYSIHKMISIIKLAKQKEKELNIPVVPVFWVAGEDHDIQEVNHVYKRVDTKLVKYKFQQKLPSDKQMVSKIRLEKAKLKAFYQELMATLGETEFSNEILEFLEERMMVSNTYTEFFVSIANELFKKYGLLFVDSAHSELRKMECDYFQTFIEQCETITANLFAQQFHLAEEGYKKTIDSKENGVQLFYEYDGERELLHYHTKKDLIEGKNIVFTKEELLKIAKETPEKLSNNVVTRPIMQEFLFPTLGFIAGPGEISYWAELKTCFESLGFKIPPIFPRTNITYLERNVGAYMEELRLSMDHVLKRGCSAEKELRIQTLKNQELEEFAEKTMQEIELKYEELIHRVKDFDKGLENIVEISSGYIQNQLAYLRKKVEESVAKRHEILLRKYDWIETSIYPFGGFQERYWNVFYYLNHYGMNFIDDLLELPLECNGHHYIIKM